MLTVHPPTHPPPSSDPLLVCEGRVDFLVLLCFLVDLCFKDDVPTFKFRTPHGCFAQDITIQCQIRLGGLCHGSLSIYYSIQKDVFRVNFSRWHIIHWFETCAFICESQMYLSYSRKLHRNRMFLRADIPNTGKILKLFRDGLQIWGHSLHSTTSKSRTFPGTLHGS